MKYRLLFISSSILGFLTLAISDARAARRLSADPIAVDEIFEVASGSKTITCGGLIKGKYLSGTIKIVDGETMLALRNDAVKAAKKKWKGEKNRSKQDKAEKKYLKIAKAVKGENKLCSYGPGGAPPAATPTPGSGGSNPGATPTPISLGNFDSGGNVTAAGKTKFGIPSNLSANLNTGKLVWNSDCKGCHSSEKTGRSFSYYKSAIRASPMFIMDETDQELADITAYLRRFELN